MLSLQVIIFSLAGHAFKCPKPPEIAKQVLNYWVDGLEYKWASKRCFNKKRYSHIRAAKGQTIDTPEAPENVILLNSKAPYRIVKVKIKDPANTTELRYLAFVEFRLASGKKRIRDKFEFVLNDGSVDIFKDRKTWGCAFHDGLNKKYLRKECFIGSKSK